MKFSRVMFVPLLAAAMVFSAEASHSAPVVTAEQTGSAQPKKARFHYVCPMHEDVTAKTAGKKCPKCKMKLEKRRVKEPTETPDQ